MPVNCPSPLTRQLSRAKKISRMRGKSTRDRTCQVCSGQCARSTTPVTSECEPSDVRSMRLKCTSGPSIVNTADMSVRIGRYC